jgi:branched-chain amino acid transport system ATP-binding protein
MIAEGTPQSEPLLAIDRLAVSYGLAVALRDVSLSVPDGGAVAVLGANGAGKTTTIRAVAGLLGLHGARVTGGQIRLRGADITRRPSHDVARLGVAHVPEGRLIFANLTVQDNLQLGASVRKSPGAEQTLELMLSLFPVLKERLRQFGGYLSGGEQQMLAISRALMADPTLVLLDEVSLGLAPMITRSIFATLGEIRRELGTAMVVIEQNANLALEFCDQAFIIENGSVTVSGPADQLRSDPTVRDLYLGGGHAAASAHSAKSSRGES